MDHKCQKEVDNDRSGELGTIDDLMEQDVRLFDARCAYRAEYRRVFGGVIAPIEDETMEMNSEIGGRSIYRRESKIMQIYSWWLKLSKWLCIAITVGMLISCALIPRSNPLLGTWVSDKEQTLAELAKKPRISDKTRALMDNDFFGKLRITYTPDSYVAALDGEVIRGKYEIIEVNKHFVEIEEYAEGDGEKTRSRIYIDGHFLYVYSPDYNLKEYFRRVK